MSNILNIKNAAEFFVLCGIDDFKFYRSCVLMPESFMNFASFVTLSIRS